MSAKDPTGMQVCAQKCAKTQDWTTIVLRTNWDLMDLGSHLNRALAFRPDDLTSEKEIQDKLADVFISAYTLAYKMGTKDVFNSIKERVESRNKIFGEKE